MIESVRKLCETHTNLTENEINILEGSVNLLQSIANLDNSDVFIDCQTKNDNAIVVASASPEKGISNYTKNVVGMFAKCDDEPAVFRSLKNGGTTRHMKARTQENIAVIQSVEPIYYANKIIGVLIKEKPLDLWKDEKELSYKLDETQIKMLLDGTTENMWLANQINEAVVLVDDNGVIIFANDLAQKLFCKLGYTYDIVGTLYEDISLINNDNINLFDDIQVQVGSYHLVVKRILMNSQNGGFVVLIRDITNVKEQEKEIILKSVAIREMHHRIKNNLSTIASLLRLQIRRTDSDDAKAVLFESMNRILAIVQTHELLARHGVDEVQICEVITNISNSTIRFYATPSFDVSINVLGGDFTVSSDIATSVALVINEALHNSLKHGFIDRNKGKIIIEIIKGDLYSKININDDGVGFIPCNTKQNSLGLQIMKSLVQDKLRGNLEINSDDTGTVVTFDFKQI